MRSIRALALILVASSAMAPRTSRAEKPAGKDILPFKPTEKTLPNGLKVIIVPTGFPNLVSLQIPVQTGSRNEVEPGKSGFAHFFEHMMFRGTEAYPPEKYGQILTQVGARQNAYTTDDYTNYHTTFSKDDLELMLKVEADRFMNLSYAEEPFKTEARAVLGEYNKNSANPLQKLEEVQRESAFTAHTYKHTTMGFLKDIEDMPNQYAYSKTFFQRFYRPEYATVIIAGDVEPKKAMRLCEKYFGPWQRGKYRAAIPTEPPSKGPVYAHVTWPTSTPPWVSVAFHGPAFSETGKDPAALRMLFDLAFGPTSDLHKKLVEDEQKVDQLFAESANSQDPSLVAVLARVKKPADALYVRDEILRTFARATAAPVDAGRLADAKSNARYGLLRGLDNTEAVASLLARFVRFSRSYTTLNNLYRTIDSLEPADLQRAAQRYFTTANLVVTTLSKDKLPQGIAKLPDAGALAPVAASGAGQDIPFIAQKTELPQLNVKIQFAVGSAHDPKGKEGLADLTAAMIADAGSRGKRIDEINKILFPLAASMSALVDKELTTFTLRVHRDNWKTFADTVLPQLIEPGFREDDFKRIKEAQLAALEVDLRSNNEEELGKERLQADIFAGTPYGHPTAGSLTGLRSITLDDVKKFVAAAYRKSAVVVGVAGNAPPEVTVRLRQELARLPAGPALPAPRVAMPERMRGLRVDIIQKDARSTAMSIGQPIDVTRSHPDFAALWLARAWLGEHRSSTSHLYQRIREVRGMNYGDYAYIEAFPRGMYQFFPDAGIPRRAQVFEIWIRPVMPQNAHMALRIALHELDQLVDKGLSQEDFERTRDYLLKNVFVMTATQNKQLGYALDSRFYGIGEFTSFMRSELNKLTLAKVNEALRRHLSAQDMQIVAITKDAQKLRDQLVADGFSAVQYDAEKPSALLDEDKVIGARKLGIKASDVTITPVDEVFK
jgi:zinc protease